MTHSSSVMYQYVRDHGQGKEEQKKVMTEENIRLLKSRRITGEEEQEEVNQIQIRMWSSSGKVKSLGIQ